MRGWTSGGDEGEYKASHLADFILR